MTDTTHSTEVRKPPSLCKHCGATATRMKDDRFWWVECDDCGMHTPASNFCNPDEVWNRAAVAPPPHKLYSELIHIAAELVRAEAFLSPYDEPKLRRADLIKTAEKQEERLKDWAYRVRQVANQLSATPSLPSVVPTETEALVKQWVATLQDESHVTDEDAEDLTLRIVAHKSRLPMRPEELERLRLIREGGRTVKAPELGDVLAILESDTEFLLSLLEPRAATPVAVGEGEEDQNSD